MKLDIALGTEPRKKGRKGGVLSERDLLIVLFIYNSWFVACFSYNLYCFYVKYLAYLASDFASCRSRKNKTRERSMLP